MKSCLLNVTNAIQNFLAANWLNGEMSKYQEIVQKTLM